MDEFRTEYEFELPKGYVTPGGDLIKKGTMRLATAADEILPMKDPRVRQNPAYLPVILLSRVIVKLGNLEQISTHIVENLYSSDFNYLQDLYNRMNQFEPPVLDVNCPHCKENFTVAVPGLGEE